MKEKILHIVGFYPPALGGIESAAASIVEILNDDFDQTVFCYNHAGNVFVDEVCDDVRVLRIPVFFKLFKRLPITLSYFVKLRRIMSLQSFGVIHIHLPNPIPAFLLSLLITDRSKLFVHWHAVIPNGIFRLASNPSSKYLLKRANTVIVATELHLKGERMLLDRRDKIVVIPFGIDFVKFEERLSTPTLAQFRERYPKKVVLFLGRHVPYKGLEILIKAANFIEEDCHILICGEGRLTPELKKLNTSQKVEFLGNISEIDKGYLLLIADIFAFPSLNYAEAFGIAMAEAMYMKTAVVSFEIPERSGVNWVSVDGLTGTVVRDRDPKLFAFAINELLSNKDKLRRYSEAARARINQEMTKELFENRIKVLYNLK